MEQIVSNFVPIFVDGYVETTLPSDVFRDLNNDVNSLFETNFSNTEKGNGRLYAAIENEYMLEVRPNLCKFIDIITKQFVSSTNHFNPRYKKIDVNALWVNLQKKHEFNPVHNHSSCDLSFVTWLNVPYDLTEEKKQPHVTNSEFVNSTTQFHFFHINPYFKGSLQSTRYTVDQNSVGKLILFNSLLQHTVYPFFTSDGYRISVAGNIKLMYD